MRQPGTIATIAIVVKKYLALILIWFFVIFNVKTSAVSIFSASEDTVYLTNIADTSNISIKMNTSGETIISFQFDIIFDSQYIEIDTNFVNAGVFLTNQTDSYSLEFRNGEDGCSVTVVGGRYSADTLGVNTPDIELITNLLVRKKTVNAFETNIYFSNIILYTDTGFELSGASSVLIPVLHYLGPKWYVNDTSLTSDVYTSGYGSDTNGYGSLDRPFRTITKALSFVKSGDTVFIDVGTYSEKVMIEVNNISLIGADSMGTLFVNTNDSTFVGEYAIIDTNNNIYISNIGFKKYYYAINLTDSSAHSTISNCYFSENRIAINLATGANNNIIENCYIIRNRDGIYLNASDTNIIQNNIIIQNDDDGIELLNSDSNIISGNICSENDFAGSNVDGVGIYIATASKYNLVKENVCDTNDRGIFLNGTGTDFNIIDSNVIRNSNDKDLSANACGIEISDGSYNIIRNNNISGSGNNGSGIYEYWNSNAPTLNEISNNTVFNNTWHGIYTTNSLKTKIEFNNVFNNGLIGIYVYTTDTAVVNNNLTDSNNSGIRIRNAKDAKIKLNTIKNNTFGLQITATTTILSLEKNNILNTDTAVFNEAAMTLNLEKFYFGSSDSTYINSVIYGGGVVSYTPFRTSEIDTTVGADTVAPAAPSFVSADTSVFGQITIEWTKPTLDEDGNMLGVGDSHLAGYRLYRVNSAECRVGGDTDDWEQFLIFSTNLTNDTNFIDTDIIQGETYYYRVVDYDSHITDGKQFYNRSWYSNSYEVKSASYSGPVWYVNDTSAANDTFCSGLGSDTNGDGSFSKPFRTISKAMSMIKSGETIYVDAGTYSETVAIDTDNISIIGADSETTTFNLNDTLIPSIKAIYAINKSGLILKNIQIKNYYYGIEFNNVDNSIIENVDVNHCGSYGFYIANSSDTNTLFNNISSYNNDKGFYFSGGSNSNLIKNNKSLYNTGNNFDFNNSNNNTILNNTVSNGSANGFHIQLSNNNTFIENKSINNILDGFTLMISCNYNLFKNNLSYNNMNGFLINDGNFGVCDNNIFFQNTVDSNADKGFSILDGGMPSSNCVFQKNIWASSGNGTDYAFYNETPNYFDFRYNYFFTTDSAVIANKISGNANWAPFRLTPIDTSIGVDTVAPASPSFISADTSVFGQIRIEWNKPTLDEDGNLLSASDTDLAGYRLYRAQSIECRIGGDTDDWEQFLILTTENTGDTEFIDTDIIAGETYYYKIVAYDSHITDGKIFYNRSWYSNSYEIKSAPVDNGSVIIFVSDMGNGDNPLSGDTKTAFPTIQSAINTTDTGNGFDTVVVFSSILTDSYFENVVMKTGLTLISAKEYFGVDTGGGGDIYPTIGSSSGMGVTMKNESKIIGFKLNGTASSGSHRGLYLITTNDAFMSNISVYNYEDGIYLMSSDCNIFQNCISYGNGGSGINFWGGSDTNIVKNCVFTNNAI
ncbi:MAG TPA: right-handed parallel beta-helix repeat-containing protein, partial [bacterium]|nr:right-handed parallel beta-helix repeat-containing protein [bacterium]